MKQSDDEFCMTKNGNVHIGQLRGHTKNCLCEHCFEAKSVAHATMLLEAHGRVPLVPKRKPRGEEGPLRIYLAGKIEPKELDWRHSLLTGGGEFGRGPQSLDNETEWSISKGAVLGAYDYTGPYFIGCDHGCAHGSNEHGVGASEERPCINGPDRKRTVKLCRDAIAASDLVFAWLDDVTAYGTIAEIGFASALLTRTFIKRSAADMQLAFPLIVVAAPKHLPDLWFVQNMADHLIEAPDPKAALEQAIALAAPPQNLCESPAEEAFLRGLNEVGAKDFTQQHPVKSYRLDFAFPDALVGIEVDGHKWHDKTPEQAERDKRRDREIQLAGWRVARFAAREVFRDAAGCARQAMQLAGRA